MTSAVAGKASTSLPFFKLEPGKFLSEVSGLRNEEVGVYIKLMSIYWVEGCRLPPEQVLYRRLELRTDKQKALLRTVLEVFFTGEGRHERLDRCLAEVQQLSRRQSDIAKKRWEGVNSKPPAEVSARNSQLPESAPQDDSSPDF